MTTTRHAWFAVMMSALALPSCVGGTESENPEQTGLSAKPARCGNGVCSGAETCSSCPADCGACPSSTCGDGSCGTGETCSSCPADCGSCNGPVQSTQWAVSDDGAFVNAENPTLKLRFAYNAQGKQGWFVGTRTSSGGGGRDGAIVELYYKPTSATRNLIFRNGTWGSCYDAMDYWEAENSATSSADFDAPDFCTNLDATVNSHSVYESAGRLIAQFDITFKAWHIIRTYTIYPWGDMTVHSRINVTYDADWAYFAHRFSFAASRYTFSNSGVSYAWGTSYAADGEHYFALSDGAPLGVQGTDYYTYDVQASSNAGNDVTYIHSRRDNYSGFMLDDTNGNDPDIVVMDGHKNIYVTPYEQIPYAIFGSTYGSYIETALFNISWAPSNETTAQMTYFSQTNDGPNGGWAQHTWSTSLGTWTEANHVYLRQGLGTQDYLPLWQARSRDLALEVPTNVVGGSVLLNDVDRNYHIAATAGATQIQFDWLRSGTASRAVDYRTTFVLDGFVASNVSIGGAGAPALDTYADVGRNQTVIALKGAQPATPVTYQISATK